MIYRNRLSLIVMPQNYHVSGRQEIFYLLLSCLLSQLSEILFQILSSGHVTATGPWRVRDEQLEQIHGDGELVN